ncbi:heavy metal translocating P-type ATPase [Natronosalvus halobius]|uniref:heavy metal translocating P-type ATPase n=1 Tax=Natronosalvus halobius TaxID=2953746 RepID=UPI00209D2AA9|nr:heavy metal translocating P-type ATPase [Natronosalvus halobius]USZ73154.1 heavy metal translocating P-type ATPase [Natronosalvus halobius]
MSDRAVDGTRAAELEVRVPEMDCSSCATKIERSLEGLDGVAEIDPAVASGRLLVRYDPDRTDGSAIRARIEGVGYDVVASTRRDDGDSLDVTGERAYAVPEMDCASCASKVDHALADVEGLESVETLPGSGRVTVTVANGSPSKSDIQSASDVDETVVAAIEGAGYDARPLSSDDGSAEYEESTPIWRTRRALTTAVGGVFLVAGMTLAFVLASANPIVATVLGREFAVSHLLFIAGAAVAGTPVLRSGYYSLRARSLDIDFLMSAGILASVAAHHPFEGAMLAVLFSVAELLERFSMDRARDSLRELMELSPETATVKRADGEEETVPADVLEPGDTVVVRPGEKIPADGVVRAGTSAVDQSPITGESVPVDRSSGDEVYAGTIAESGYLEVDVTSEVGESTLSRIVDLVADAERERTNRERTVDRFASVYTPIVVVSAVALAVGPPLLVGADWNTWFLRGLTLLVIACPCAFVISTPVSVVSGITSAAKNGVLIKGGRYLEAVGESDVLAVDKTGTLTTGELSVTDVVVLEGADEDDVLARAAALERRSEHPVGEAIVGYADERGVDGNGADATVTDFEALTGRGVRGDLDGERHYVGKPDLFDGLGLDLEHTHVRTDGGFGAEAEAGTGTRTRTRTGDLSIDEISGAVDAQPRCSREDCLDLLQTVVPRLESEGKTVVLVGTDDRLLGLVAVADQVRPEAAWAVSALQDQGVRVVMLTGDNEGTARAIAEQVGIDEYHAELLPEEKLEAIRELEGGDSSGTERTVAMVGDGINDAPALATASVGIAMGAAGTDTALETADVALMGDDLTRLPYLYRLSGTANGVIRQNIGSSLAVKAVLAAGAPFGLVTIIHAVVIGDMGMSLAVTGNAMRLSRVEPETPDDDNSPA